MCFQCNGTKIPDQFDHCDITTPVTPLLARDAPVLPERNQGCGIPLKKKKKKTVSVTQCWLWREIDVIHFSVQLTTSLRRNDDPRNAAALRRNSGRNDSRSREAARGNGLVPDKDNICKHTLKLEVPCKSSSSLKLYHLPPVPPSAPLSL